MRLFAAALVTLLLLAPADARATSDGTGKAEALKLFSQALEHVRKHHVDAPDTDKLVEAAINNMLRSLDPHSKYLTVDRYADLKSQNNGEFGGIGVEMTVDNGRIKVLAPIDGSPAFRAGLKAGDLLTHINGEPFVVNSLAQAIDRMRGSLGAPIQLRVQRGPAAESFDVTLVREMVKSQPVRWHTEGNIGYIKISSFNRQTQTGLDKAMAELDASLGNRLAGYVLDLRGNPGGLLRQAVTVVDTFLHQGEIVSTRSRNTDNVRRFSATPGDMARGLPVVVLVNGRTASASEIVAGALQDHRRAIILGTKSFGKGSVQTIMPLSNQGAIRLTTSRYYTPSGRSIQALGIEPDIEVQPARLATDKSYDHQLARALDLLRGFERFQPPARSAVLPAAATESQPGAGTAMP